MSTTDFAQWELEQDDLDPITYVDRGELTAYPRTVSWIDIVRGFTAGSSLGVVVGLGLWWTEIHG